MNVTDQFLTETWDDETTSFDKHLPTVPLDDDVWVEEPIPDRCLCIHNRPDALHCQCLYSCLYDSISFRMDLLQSTPWNAVVFNYEQMDFSDISSDLPDIMMMMSDTDIPHPTDVSDAVWFT